MKIEITPRHESGVIVLETKGKMMIPAESNLREFVREAMEAGSRGVLIDLQDVPMIDSWGIGELVWAYTTVTKRGGKLKLLKPSPKVFDILEITRLMTVFETFQDETEAIDSFA
jgi:anti-sigma B factor antagonist